MLTDIVKTVDASGAPTPAAPRAGWLVIGVFAVIVVAAYRNTLTAPFVLDDGGSVTENATIRHLWTSLRPLAGGYTVSGRPVFNFSLAVNYALSGEAVWSYHLLNVAIHFLAGCTLFGLVRRTLALPAQLPRFAGAELPLAAAIAGLWLVHPLQTEAVTYVSQRTESLAGLFFFLTLYAFVRSIGSDRPLRWRALAVASCALGMGTKEIMATAPFLVLLYDRTFVAGSFRETWRRRRGIHVPLMATWLPLAWFVATTGWNRGGTSGFGSDHSIVGYWLTQAKAIVTYLSLTAWPSPLSFDHGTIWMTFREAAPYAVVAVPLAAATAVALWRWPTVGFLGAWFFVILAPTSVVPGTIQMIVEHRMYLPLAAPISLVVAGAYARFGRTTLLAWPVLAAALTCLAYTRNEAYASDLALWRDTVAKEPNNVMARYSLGIAYSDRGDYAKAVEQGEAALASVHRDDYAPRLKLVHNKLGHDLMMTGRNDEAIVQFQEALRLDPKYAIAHLNLARVLTKMGRYPDAIVHYEAALQRHFGGPTAEMELSDALMREHRTTEAAAHLRAALRETPAWAPGWNNLGYALLLTGNVNDSIAAYREAVRLDPQYAAAWVGLGYALITDGRPGDAVAPCTKAVTLAPHFADAQNTLGIALIQSGDATNALPRFERAVQLNPNGADVHNNLGNALAAVGRHDEALGQYRQAVKLDPEYVPARRNLGEELRRAGHFAEAADHLAIAARLESATANAAAVGH